jgi:hypothetical protein
MAQHVRMYLHIESGSNAGALNHSLKTAHRKGCAAFGNKDEGGSWIFPL